MVGDELLALKGWRLHQPDDVAPLLEPAAALGTAEAGIPLLYARDGQVRATHLSPAPPATEGWDLKPDAEADAASLERRRLWLALELP